MRANAAHRGSARVRALVVPVRCGGFGLVAPRARSWDIAAHGCCRSATHFALPSLPFGRALRFQLYLRALPLRALAVLYARAVRAAFILRHARLYGYSLVVAVYKSLRVVHLYVYALYRYSCPICCYVVPAQLLCTLFILPDTWRSVVDTLFAFCLHADLQFVYTLYSSTFVCSL